MVSKNFFPSFKFPNFRVCVYERIKGDRDNKKNIQEGFSFGELFIFCNLFITNQYDCFTVQMTERDYTTFETIDLTSEEVLQCSYSNWSKLFPGKTFPSKIIKPLPSTF